MTRTRFPFARRCTSATIAGSAELPNRKSIRRLEMGSSIAPRSCSGAFVPTHSDLRHPLAGIGSVSDLRDQLETAGFRAAVENHATSQGVGPSSVSLQQRRVRLQAVDLLKVYFPDLGPRLDKRHNPRRMEPTSGIEPLTC